MTDRYHGHGPTGRSATFSPTRTSLPSSIGYNSLYAGDMHILPPSMRHPTATPTGYSTSTTNTGVPTTTRTYAVSADPRARAAREGSRTRRSTLDSNSRPPVIVTTTQKGPYNSAVHPTSHIQPMSPAHHDHRTSEGHLYAQPASSSHRRSRSTTPAYRSNTADGDYSRTKERHDSGGTSRDMDPYRNSRPSVVYPSDPKHSTAAVEYADDDFQYTKPSDLARYDLDHPKAAKSSRRRESMDRGYHRPSVNYNNDQRNLNVNTSADLSRNYNMNTSRPYDGRGGPPPSTRGFDRINRGYDSRDSVPPAAPPPPASTAAGHAEISGASADWRDSRRTRPVSLYQESTTPRSSHHDDYYRSREDERNLREVRDRDRESERTHDAPHYRDEEVPSRGFGIRAGPGADDRDDRRDRHRDSWRDDGKPRADRVGELRKRSDEELPHERDAVRDDRRRSRVEEKDDRRERLDTRRGGSDEERDRSRLRDKLASGVGIAAAAVGLGSSKDKEKDKDDDKREKAEKEPRRRRSASEDRERRPEPETYERAKPSDRERERDRYPERERDRDRERERDREYDRRDSKDDYEAKERHRRDAEARLAGEERPSEIDEPKRSSRPAQAAIGFDPNDAMDISKLKEQLASMDSNEKVKDKVVSQRARSNSPGGELVYAGDADDPRGRQLSLASSSEGKSVRLVSPPRDKKDDRPLLRGILKQPKVTFPEENNYIREGVAPHKDDKKAKDVPQGAKWTKISRKIVNPEALTVGKERFEVRDDFVIVLRVLDKEEIQAYAAATKVLRDRRRAREEEGDDKDVRYDDREEDPDEDRRRSQRNQRRYKEDENNSDYDDRSRDKESDRRRRQQREEDGEDYDRHHHHRSHRAAE